MTDTSPSPAAGLPTDNPFAAPSPLPFGLPPFTEIRDEHFAPALDAGFAQQRAEVEAIAANPEPPTFANTVEPLERSGALLGRVLAVLWARASADATDAVNALREQYAGPVAAHFDAIALDPRLAERIRALHDGLDAPGDGAALDAEQRALVERLHLERRLAGAGLDEDDQTELRRINERLAELSTRFVTNLQADTNELAVRVDDPAELDGLGPDERAAAEQAARDAGHDGWRIDLPLYTGHPWLAQLRDRDLRRRIHDASRSRGSCGDEHDNSAIVLEIVRLRARKARLLGYEHYADLVAADAMAGTAAAIEARLRMLAVPAVRNARAELDRIQAFADAERTAAHDEPFAIEAHDWVHYQERLRAEQADFDTGALRPWFELDRVLVDGVLFAAGLAYGLSFEPRPDLAGDHSQVRVWLVRDADGAELGLYLLDPYARATKRGGAWMSTYVQQNELLDERTVVYNVLNVPEPPAGSPTLLTLDEVETLFHEFGHALHGLLAHVRHPHFGGTNVRRDFVEFPSQVNELWLRHPAVLANYARHHVTGEPLPAEQAERLRAPEHFGEGFATSEYLAAAALDLAWHTLTVEEADAVADVGEFEREALTRAGLLLPEVPTRYSTCYFQHIFEGGYAAGYYGYIW
ncbi:MAG: M3 family metallopeptidase, partial [Microbacteriaceae bacterium]|nr:M3 family metallopeptidase [Microbacteriaceae bacterium]